MASVDNYVVSETAPMGFELVRAQLTGGTSTYTSERFGYVEGFTMTVEGTNTTTATRSGKVITVTGTNNDFVNLIIWGMR